MANTVVLEVFRYDPETRESRMQNFEYFQETRARCIASNDETFYNEYIEPIIGHTKSDGLLERNHLAGATGDAINAILVAAGHNLRLLIAWLNLLLRVLLAACLPAAHREMVPA